MRSSKWLVFIRSLLAGFDRSLTLPADNAPSQQSWRKQFHRKSGVIVMAMGIPFFALG
jgi:hypothetical protein